MLVSLIQFKLFAYSESWTERETQSFYCPVWMQVLDVSALVEPVFGTDFFQTMKKKKTEGKKTNSLHLAKL